MWIILLVSVVTLLYLWVKWKYTYWSRRGVPGPQPTLILGNIGPTLMFKDHIINLIGKWYNEYENVPYVGFYKLLQPAVMLRDPDLIKDVLIKDAYSFHANELAGAFDERRDPLLAWNPFVCEGEKWRRGRNLLNPLFTANKVKALYGTMETACDRLTHYLKKQPPGKDLEAKSLSAKFSTENVIKCAFSIDAHCFDDEESEFRKFGKNIFQPSALIAFKFMVMPLLPKWLINIIPVPFLSGDVDTWFRRIIVDNRKSREGIDSQNEDLLHMLLALGKKQDASDEELASHTLSFFIEGFETSSSVLSFVLYELARNPEIQERLHNEVVEVLGKHNNKFSYEALQEMTYLECVLQETHRLEVVVFYISKICTQQYTLPKFGNQKEGVTINPGTTVVIPVRAIHLDESYYPDPEIFNPDRFTEEERKVRHKAHFLPFSEGPRMCMGMRFANTQIKAAVMTVVRDFKITLSPNHKPFEFDIQAALWQAKDGLLLNFQPR